MKAPDDTLYYFEQRLGVLLNIGVLLSAAALATGLGVGLLAPGRAEAPWLLRAGLIALMATPMLRVVVSLVEYLLLRDWFFVSTTLAVLLQLAITVMTALGRR